MNQRGITMEMVALVMQFGAQEGDRYVLNRDGAIYLLNKLRKLQRVAMQVIDKKGVVVVAANDEHFVTTYNLDSYDRNAQ
jgi:hypothetical protein